MTDGSDEVARLRAELEQTRVLIEDMEEQVAALAAANAELSEQLTGQTRLREAAEHELAAAMAAQRKEKSADDLQMREDAAMRQELNVALEELQVMLEELQSAHDALSTERQGVLAP